MYESINRLSTPDLSLSQFTVSENRALDFTSIELSRALYRIAAIDSFAGATVLKKGNSQFPKFWKTILMQSETHLAADLGPAPNPGIF